MTTDLLEVLLDSWDRSNTILVNLLRSVPPGGLEARAMPGSPRVAEMFTHMHHERMISVLENAPEHAGTLPATEWVMEPDASRIEGMLVESHRRVRDAVDDRVRSERPLDREFAHPILLLQLLIFHEAYHHGQVKLALKGVGLAVPDEQAGALTWDVWRHR